MKNLIQLYPKHLPLESIHGLYLAEQIGTGEAIVYANFVSSLDGRIAVKQTKKSFLPKQLTNSSDFRLFLELQAHTDCLVTHAGYLRARAAGDLGDILNIGNVSGHEDLSQWRRRQGLASTYTLVVCSKSLDFPEPDPAYRKHTIIAACEDSPEQKIKIWRDKGYSVVIAGEQWVRAKDLIPLLKQQGYRAIFLAAGPKLLTSSIHDKCLDLLYLTISHQLIAGKNFHTLIEGLDTELQHCRLEQKHLIYDSSPSLPHPQWYVRFDCHY